MEREHRFLDRGKRSEISRTMKSFALLVLLLSPCAPVPEPVTPPRPEPVPEQPVVPPEPANEAGTPRYSNCQKACMRMFALGCIDSEQTPGGISCEHAFCDNNAGWDYVCMQQATSCDGMNRCNR
jgi:hypothetical protein